MKKNTRSVLLKHVTRGSMLKVLFAWCVGVVSEVIIQFNLFESLYNFTDFHVLGFAISKSLMASFGVFSASLLLSYLLRQPVMVRFFFSDLPRPKLKSSAKFLIISVLLCFALSGLLNAFYIFEKWSTEGMALGQFTEVLMAVLLCALSVLMLALSGLAGAVLLTVLPVRSVKRALNKTQKARIAMQKKCEQLLLRGAENERLFKEIDTVLGEKLKGDTMSATPTDLNTYLKTLNKKK